MAKARNKSVSQAPPARAFAHAESRDSRWQTGAICLALGAMTLGVFGRTARYGFINFDDTDYVYQNAVVSQGLTLKGLAWAFSFHANNWHPLTWLSHMLDCQLYGLRAGGHHLTNVLLHTATAILLFLVSRRMTGAVWRSAFVAAVFAIHPLRVESVAWVAERKDVLSGLFFVLTIGAYVRYARQAWSPLRYGSVMLSFALGLMCKPMLVTLPIVLLLLDYWPLQRRESPVKLVLEKAPLLVLSAASCVATFLAQHTAIQSIAAFPFSSRLGNAAVSGMVYLCQMVWPAGLAVFYPYPQGGLPAWKVAFGILVVAGVSVVAWNQRRARPWLSMGWAWYLVMLLPVAGIVQVGGQAHADRYTYLPQIGIYIALTWLAAEFAARRQMDRAVVGGLAAGVVAVLMVCAGKQTAYWKNSETFWPHTIACTTNNEMAHYNFGVALDEKGKSDDAITQYREALQIRPDYGAAHNNLGLVLLQQGKIDEAIGHFQRALQTGPDYVEPCINLGNALLREGKVKEAIAHFQQALQLQPGNATGHNNLGDALLQKGNSAGAEAEYEKTLEIDPGYAEASYSLGNIFLQRGRVDEAIALFERALQSKPDYAKACNNLGNALAQKGRIKDAIGRYEQGQRLDPADPAVKNNLAWLLATATDASLRNGPEAVELAQQANSLTGGENPMVLRTLAAALAEAGRYNDAASAARKAIEIARKSGREDIAQQLESELQRYQAGFSFHH